MDESSKLARLLGDLEELEKSRIGLLDRVERLRADLLAGGDRTTAMRATLELLCDHIAELVTNSAEFSMLEREIEDGERRAQEASKESAALAFEAESLQQTLQETDDDLERLSSMLLERRVKPSKGH